MCLLRLCAALLASNLLVCCHGFTKSRIECLEEADESAKLCMLKDVAIWNGKIYIIQQQDTLHVPQVTVATFTTLVNPRVVDLHYNVTDFIRSVELDSLPFKDSATITTHSHAVLHHASLPSNHAHNMLETIPALFDRLCRFFGMCDNSDQRMREEGGLLVLWVQRHARKAVLPALHDIVACMSSRQLAVESASSDEVILVKELLIGHPSTEACQSEPLCMRYNAFNQTDLVMMRLRFMRHCVGLPPQPPFRREGPRVLFVNRQYAAGRSVLTMAEAYNHFALNQYEQQKHTPFRLVYMEGLSLKEQAKLVNSADVLVMPHGAAFGNLIFAAQKSVIVHVSASKGHMVFNEVHSHEFDSILAIRTTAIHASSSGGLDPISARMPSEIKDWPQQHLLDFILRGACPQNEGWCRDYNLFSRYFNYSIPLEDLIAAVVEAIQAWHDIRRV